MHAAKWTRRSHRDAMSSLPCKVCVSRPIISALTVRFTAALSPAGQPAPRPSGAAPAPDPPLDPQAIATWLFMYASLRHHDAELLDAVSSYAARHPAARFRTLAALSTALWAFARLSSHPSRLLDLCHLSAPDLLLPLQQHRGSLTIEVRACACHACASQRRSQEASCDAGSLVA